MKLQLVKSADLPIRAGKACRVAGEGSTPRRKLWLLAGAVAAVFTVAQPLHATQLLLCVEEVPQPPLITPAGEGDAGLLIRKAAKLAGITVRFRPVPMLRCREELRLGRSDGYPVAPYSPTVSTFLAFPMKGDQVDISRAVGEGRIIVYRRAGSSVDWDGRRFRNLSTAVLVPAGATMLEERFGAMGISIDKSGRSTEANFRKLLAGRADIAVAPSQIGNALIAQAQFSGHIEAIARPFLVTSLYLGLSLHFVEQHPIVAEKLWDAIRCLRQRIPCAENGLGEGPAR